MPFIIVQCTPHRSVGAKKTMSFPPTGPPEMPSGEGIRPLRKIIRHYRYAALNFLIRRLAYGIKGLCPDQAVWATPKGFARGSRQTCSLQQPRRVVPVGPLSIFVETKNCPGKVDLLGRKNPGQHLAIHYCYIVGLVGLSKGDFATSWRFHMSSFN